MAHIASFKIGDWEVYPELDRIIRGNESKAIRPQVMELLTYLAKRAGQVISTDELLSDLWAGKVVTPASAYNCVGELRRVFEEDQGGDPVIETIPKRGYRLVAPVKGLNRRRFEKASPARSSFRRNWVIAGTTVLMLGLALTLYYLPTRQDGQRDPPAGVKTSASDISIAVLPFADLSPNGDQTYFSKGIAEEILNTLSVLHGIRVISRASSFALNEAGLTASEVADALAVDYLLEGSVRKMENTVRVTAQLIDTSADTYLWSQSWERPLGDILAIEDEIAVRIGRELNVYVSAKRSEVGAASPAAYDIYLRGLALLANRGSGIDRAAELFEQAIAMDPAFAAAHGSLALAHIWSEENSKVERTAQRALALDPGNSDALTALGFLRDAEGKIDEARQAFERAILRNPNNAMAYRWLGRSLSTADPVRYLKFARKAYLTDPLDPTIHFHLAQALSSMGRYAEAFDAAKQLVSRKEEALGLSTKGLIHHKQYELADAVKAYYRSTNYSPAYERNMVDLVWALMELGEYDLAKKWLDERNRLARHSAPAMLEEIVLTDSRGNADQLDRLLSEAARQRWLVGSELGRAIVLVDGDFMAARTAFERDLPELGGEAVTIDFDRWPIYVDYALALQWTGAQVQASKLIEDLIALIEEQASSGVVSAPFGFMPHQLFLGALHAMTNRPELAVQALEGVAQANSMLCTICLREWPHFDSLRGHPKFVSLISNQDERAARERERLVDKGLILSPAEVRREATFH